MRAEEEKMNKKEEQFQQLFTENKDRVFRICCSYVKSDDRRQDLFQEIFMNIWSNLDSFRGKSHINTWIYRISINTSINFCRLQSKIDNRCKEIKQDILSVDEQKLQDKYAEEEDIQKMFAAINELPVLEKSIISLVLEGVDHVQIAQICGISEGNVRVKFHRIKKKLQKMMEEK